MGNRKFKSEQYRRNFTLKHLLSCTNQLDNLYEKYINRITKVLQRDNYSTVEALQEALRHEWAWFAWDKYEIIERCPIQGGYEQF